MLPFPGRRREDELLSVLGEVRDNLRLKQFGSGSSSGCASKLISNASALPAFRKTATSSSSGGGRCGRFQTSVPQGTLTMSFSTAPVCLALAGPTVLGVEVRGVVLRDEVVDVVVRLQDHVATLAAVAAAGPPLGLERSCEKAMQPLPPLRPWLEP